MASFKLKKFNINSIPDDATICYCGKRRSGKSVLIRELMYHKRAFPAGVVLAPTDSMTHSYAQFIPHIFVHYEYKPELLSKLFMRQQLLADENVERSQKGKKPRDSRAYLIMDDCLATKGEWAKDPNIAEVFYNGRHRKILFMLSMQFPLGIKPELRANFDYVFLLAEDFLTNQKRLYEHYAGCFPSFEMFRKVFMEVTKDFGCLVIDNKDRSPDITKKCFWYRACDPGNFMVGTQKTIDYCKRTYDPNWQRRNRPFDIQEYLRKKSKVHVQVELEGEDD
jgi:hypothetical protein